MKSGFIETHGARLHYQVAGTGPKVVFIHAGVADSRMWTHQLGSLADTHTVIAFDQRGFGATEFSPGPYADREDTISVMDHLGVDRAVLVGCSNGGGIALQVALDWPDRVAGLVLVGAAPAGWEPQAGWYGPPEDEEAENAAEAGDVERAVRLDCLVWLVGTERSIDEVDPSLVALFVNMDEAPVRNYAFRDEHIIRFGSVVNDRLDEIDVPCLVVVGAYDLPDLLEAADYLASRLSHRPVSVIPGAAHLPSSEKPEEFSRLLRRFLSRL